MASIRRAITISRCFRNNGMEGLLWVFAKRCFKLYLGLDLPFSPSQDHQISGPHRVHPDLLDRLFAGCSDNLHDLN